MRLCWTAILLLLAPAASAQTVVEMDLDSARQLLASHDFEAAWPMLTQLANNYRHHSNIRVISRRHQKELALLARALRTDFDGSGAGYLPELTIWGVFNQVGGRTYLAASLLNRKAVLLSNDLDYLKGMLAYELLHALRQGHLSLDQARRKALALGIEMQVDEADDGARSISFFGHDQSENQLVGKLVVIEPPDFVW